MRALYRHMVLTRALEDRLESLFKQGHVVGGLYRCLGQEATAVGSSYALEDGDWLAPSIRDVGALYVRGLPPIAMLRQYAARAASPCGGKDNTTHFTIPELGLLGPISPLGTQLCVLNGMALTFKQRGQTRVCMTYQGEGASRTGASHEGFVMAAAHDLPMVIVLEHNRWSFGTRSDKAAAVQDWAHTAEAYGLPVRSVDGNDVLEVYEAAREAVGLYRRLAAERPESGEVALAWALHGLGRRERDCGRLAAAVGAASEAMAIVAPRAEQLADAEADRLERVLSDYLDAIGRVGREPRADWVGAVASVLGLGSEDPMVDGGRDRRSQR